MKQYFQKIVIVFSVLIPNSFFGQDVSLLEQFNGRYDFIFLGNTLNPAENSFQTFPSVYTSSSEEIKRYQALIKQIIVE